MRRSSSRSCSLCARARAADPSPAPLPPLVPPLLPLLPVALPRPPARSPGIHHAFSGRRAALVDREAHTCTRPRRRLGRPRLGSRRRLGLGRVVRVRRLLPRRACACARASLGTGTGTGVGGSVWRERAARRVERAPRRRGRRSGCVGRELARGADEDWAAVRRFLSLSLLFLRVHARAGRRAALTVLASSFAPLSPRTPCPFLLSLSFARRSPSLLRPHRRSPQFNLALLSPSLPAAPTAPTNPQRRPRPRRGRRGAPPPPLGVGGRRWRRRRGARGQRRQRGGGRGGPGLERCVWALGPLSLSSRSCSLLSPSPAVVPSSARLSGP